jgi:hypothetical protein
MGALRATRLRVHHRGIDGGRDAVRTTAPARINL